MAAATAQGVHLPHPYLHAPSRAHSYGHEIERYWDRHERRFTVELLPGQSYVAEDDELLTTVVGAGCCICVRHRQSHVAAMASLLLSSEFGAMHSVKRCLDCLEDLTESVFDASDSDELCNLEAWVVVGGDIGSLTDENREVQLGLVTTILLGYGVPVVEMHLGETRPLGVSFEPRGGKLALSELQRLSLIDMRRDLEHIARLRLDHQSYDTDEDLQPEDRSGVAEPRTSARVRSPRSA